MVNGITDQRIKFSAIMVSVLLIAVVVALYWPVTGYDFIALDDNLYLLDNQNVQQGITGKNLIWAMTTLAATNWHPLTWLSLIIDYDFFGLNAAGYHLTNLILHILNTVFLFLVLRRMTGEVWKGFVIAALFAVHPLNIESVVWIAERKNLLSTLFWILTMLAYVHHAEKPGWKNYSMILVYFILGLMAKPMLVTLPFILLLLDYWPLQRFSSPDRSRPGAIQDRAEQRKRLTLLLLEKVPLILLSFLSAFITFHAARTGGAVKTITVFPLIGRIENAFISYVMYLIKAVWPADLAIFYPYPVGRPVWQVVSSILVLTIVTALVCLKGRKYRYLITGWFWYLITLLPVIGFIQVGFQSMANRYAYISLIGLFVIVTWGLKDLLKGYSVRRYLPVISIAVILALIFGTKSALPDWKNSETVFQQALNVTRNNHIAEIGMGNVRLGRGDLRGAGFHYLEALRIKPDYAEAHNNLGLVRMREGRVNEAEVQYREALKDNPDYPEAYNNLGVVFAGQGNWREAEDGFRRALQLKPDYRGAQNNLTMIFRQQGKNEDILKQIPVQQKDSLDR